MDNDAQADEHDQAACWDAFVGSSTSHGSSSSSSDSEASLPAGPRPTQRPPRSRAKSDELRTALGLRSASKQPPKFADQRTATRTARSRRIVGKQSKLDVTTGDESSHAARALQTVLGQAHTKRQREDGVTVSRRRVRGKRNEAPPSEPMGPSLVEYLDSSCSGAARRDVSFGGRGR